MRSRIVFGTLMITGAFTSLICAQGKTSPPRPYVDKGACPFECCTYREWEVEKPTILRTAMKDASPIAFRLKKGERVVGVTGVVITSRAGEARVLKRTKLGKFVLNAGDKVFLLTYLGEGFYKVWYKGKIFEEATYDESKFKMIRQPEAVWWVKVRNGRGQIGWSRKPDDFGNKDQCATHRFARPRDSSVSLIVDSRF